jgi:hypothetical protein
MNETDLRLAFKMDTSYYPCWPDTGRFERYPDSIRGLTRSTYAKWLEEKFEKPLDMRRLFNRETGLGDPVIDNGNYYVTEYRNWLERKALCNRKVLVQIKSLLNL